MQQREWMASQEEATAFLAELRELYARHGLRLASSERIVVHRISGGGSATEAVRVRSRFQDPEDGEDLEFGERVYEDVPVAAIETDRIFSATFDAPREFLEY